MKKIIALFLIVFVFSPYLIFADRVCDGSVEQCLQNMPAGWSWEGIAVKNGNFTDVCAVKLDNGSIRLYGNSPDYPNAVASYISSNGKIFIKENGLRVSSNAFMPYVVKLSNGKFRMYYTAINLPVDNSFGPDSGYKAIVSAISSDGINFEPEDGYRLYYDKNSNFESEGIRGAKILPLRDGGFRMYYLGIDKNGIQRLLSAYSKDGLNWNREKVILEPQSLCSYSKRIWNVAPFSPYANSFYLFFTGEICDDNTHTGGIFLATSKDGLNFTVNHTPILSSYYLKSSFNGDYFNDPINNPQDPSVIMTNEGLKMFFGVYDRNAITNDSAIYSIVYNKINYIKIYYSNSNKILNVGVNVFLNNSFTENWCAVLTPDNNIYFFNGSSWSNKIMHFNDTINHINNFTIIKNLNYENLPKGSYTFYFGSDEINDNQISTNSLIFDYLKINLQ